MPGLSPQTEFWAEIKIGGLTTSANNFSFPTISDAEFDGVLSAIKGGAAAISDTILMPITGGIASGGAGFRIKGGASGDAPVSNKGGLGSESNLALGFEGSASMFL